MGLSEFFNLIVLLAFRYHGCYVQNVHTIAEPSDFYLNDDHDQLLAQLNADGCSKYFAYDDLDSLLKQLWLHVQSRQMKVTNEMNAVPPIQSSVLQESLEQVSNSLVWNEPPHSLTNKPPSAITAVVRIQKSVNIFDPLTLNSQQKSFDPAKI